MSIAQNCRLESGVMSVWLGCFANPEDFYRYVQTCYCSDREEEQDPEYIFSPAEFQRRREALFLPENANRPEEGQLRTAFAEKYNRFEYDFGLLIDEDFAVCDYCPHPTCDLSELLEEWPELLDPLKELVKSVHFQQPVNCLFAIPSCAYNGVVRQVSPDGGQLWFVGNMQEGVFSDTLAEDYHRVQMQE